MDYGDKKLDKNIYGFDDSGIRVVSTIVLMKRDLALKFQEAFVSTEETIHLLLQRVSDLGSNKLIGNIDEKVITESKKICPGSVVRDGYLIRHIISGRWLELARNLDDFLMLRQVEMPSEKYRQKYRHIDIGVTSNGKRNKGESVVECSRRESREEIRLALQEKDYDVRYQKLLRIKNNVEGLPLYMRHGPIICIILMYEGSDSV